MVAYEAESNSVSDYVKIKVESATVTSPATMNSGDTLALEENEPRNWRTSDYFNKLTSLEVNGKSYSKTELGIGAYTNAINLSNKVKGGTNNIVVQSTGYGNYSFTVHVTKVDNTSKLVLENQLSEEKGITVENPTDMVIALGNYTKDYALTSVIVNEVAIDPAEYEVEKLAIGYTYY